MEGYHLIDIPIKYGAKLTKERESKLINIIYYKSLVSHIWRCTQPNILLRVELISRFIKHPKISHLSVAKRIL